MNVLMVGAGAVGQLYGYHLQAGGARLAFLVKEKYAEACRAGLFLYRYRWSRKPRKMPFTGFDVLTSPKEVAARSWDQVWLSVSSPALRGPWLDALVAAMGEAALVTLQPGLRDRDYLLERVPEARLVSGVITPIAWQTPLPGETVDPPGVGFYLPPLTPLPLSGPEPHVDRAVAALRAGGLRAKRVPDAARATALGSAVMMPVIAALRTAGWSLKALRKGPLLRLGLDAAAEARAVAATIHGLPVGGRPLLTRRWVMAPALALAPSLMPFDLETYLRYHFTKVGDQTIAALDTYVAEAEAAGLPCDALRRLRAGLDEAT